MHSRFNRAECAAETKLYSCYRELDLNAADHIAVWRVTYGIERK